MSRLPKMGSPSLLLVAIALATLVQPAQSDCYYPNGNVAGGNTPCRDSTAYSTCCGEGYACLSNNMCMLTDKVHALPGSSVYARGSCTDPSWKSADCPLFCIDPEINRMGAGESIGRCNDSTLFFCMDSSDHDCEKRRNVLFFQGRIGFQFYNNPFRLQSLTR